MNTDAFAKAITKVLSANDTGDTGGHQAGMLIPRDPDVLGFFPSLDDTQKNPRHHLIFWDESDLRWEFAYIYYNNRFFGGTRNEYRLTRMTKFIRQYGLKLGDVITLVRREDGRNLIQYTRTGVAERTPGDVLRLGTSWKVIDF